MILKPEEKKIVGRWITSGTEVVADANSLRIEKLIDEFLVEAATSEDGWDKLYIDESDMRFWELIYSESDSHGAGAPILLNLSIEEVKSKYGAISISIGEKTINF
ncbi:MAG: hypothetical protein HWE16_05500 [Gammaproteobacteria bacterium]|nr:hypothetical protein [Gammaproteobacteria bacterium]